MGYRGLTRPLGVVDMRQYGYATEAHERSSASKNFSMTRHGPVMVSHEGRPIAMGCRGICRGNAMVIHSDTMATHGYSTTTLYTSLSNAMTGSAWHWRDMDMVCHSTATTTPRTLHSCATEVLVLVMKLP